MDKAHLIFHLRAARSKAREAATLEALCLLRDLGAVAPSGGPLSEKGRTFWIDMPADNLDMAQDRLSLLGYTVAVDLLQSVNSRSRESNLVRWRRRDYRLSRMYEEDPQIARERAPDRRMFLLETGGGEVRRVRGYRGNSSFLSRRGLPAYDASFLANLVFTARAGSVFLDPFAGIGGTVIEAIKSGHRAFSCDIDPALRFGLDHLGAEHCVADARNLPFQSESIHAIATEPPYEKQTGDLANDALVEMHRVLKPNGRIAIMCATWQADGLRGIGKALEFEKLLDSPLDRKGVDCVLLAWEKPG